MPYRSIIVMNGACSLSKTVEDTIELAKTKIDAIVIGSATVRPRAANQEPRFFANQFYSLNSFGMPNGGFNYYKDHLVSIASVAHQSGKKIVFNIAGFKPDEYGHLAQLAKPAGVDVVECNLACPNVKGKRGQIGSFNHDFIRQAIEAAVKATDVPLYIKLSPYSDPSELESVSKLLAKFNQVVGVVACNSFPGGLMLDRGSPVVGSELGGVSGKALLPISLGQVKQYRQLLPSRIHVVGAGGAETREDVLLYKQAGASSVQAATLIVKYGYKAIDRLMA